ncbi:MAG: PhoU domain-containing protein, partial [Pseudomonadota bacterium]
MSTTTRLRLRRKIEKLKHEVLTIGTQVEEHVRMAVKAMKLNDSRMAARVIDSDAEIDRMEVDLEEECLEILALHQPVAVDLRFIIGVLKINQDLERIGDLAVNIAETAVFLASQPKLDIPEDYYVMAVKT